MHHGDGVIPSELLTAHDRITKAVTGVIDLFHVERAAKNHKIVIRRSGGLGKLGQCLFCVEEIDLDTCRGGSGKDGSHSAVFCNGIIYENEAVAFVAIAENSGRLTMD